MSERRLFLDDGPGEQRGVVTLNGAPERLLTDRFDDVPAQLPQARVMARVRKIDRGLGSAFLDLGQGPDGLTPLPKTGRSWAEGAWLDVEIIAAGRGRKGPTAKVVGDGAGPLRVLAEAPKVGERLTRFAPETPVIRGAAAREAADIAEAAAMAVEHMLPSGGRIFIEPTQALTAVDVDLAATSGAGRQAAGRANREALLTAARLLRLKGLGGLVAIDFVGKGHDGAQLSAVAKTAFAPDGAAVSIGPISRFGVMELTVPRSARPFFDRMLDAQGRPHPAATACRLVRAIEQSAGPGQSVQAACAQEVADLAARIAPDLLNRIGPRYTIHVDSLLAPSVIKVFAQ